MIAAVAADFDYNMPGSGYKLTDEDGGMASTPPVSGQSRVLRDLWQWASGQTPWLAYAGDKLVFDWDKVVSAWERAHPEAAAADERVAPALTALLPALPLSVFAANAPAVNYFQGDERTAGLTLATHPIPAQLMEMLEAWGRAVDRFRTVLGDEGVTDAGRVHELSKDAWILRSMATSEALASAVAFRQTLNVNFNLTNRLCVGGGDMAMFLSGAPRTYNTDRLTLTHKQQVVRELQHLGRVRRGHVQRVAVGGRQQPAEGQVVAGGVIERDFVL